MPDVESIKAAGPTLESPTDGPAAATQAEADQEEQRIHRLLGRTPLGFPPDLEKEFRYDYIERSKSILRISLVLGMILYSVFGLLDRILAPQSFRQIWLIRFVIIDPILVGVFILTYFRVFLRVMQLTFSFIGALAGLGIAVMIAIMVESNAALYYYAGLILVLMWIYTFTRLLFRYATIGGWVVVLAYEVVAIYFKDMLATPETMGVFINNNFFFISANVMGMFVTYLFEVAARKDFLQRKLIDRNQRELERERNALFEWNRVMRQELAMARVIQQKLIPDRVPSSRLYAIYKPMEAVGGDFFDFPRLPGNGQIGIFLSDVSGHGVPAALITSMMKSAIIDSKELLARPADLLSHLNDVLTQQIQDYFVTAFFGVYDTRSRTLAWCSAGHNPPFLLQGRTVKRLEGEVPNLPLAVMSNTDLVSSQNSYRGYTTVLPPRSKLILYTDGLVEARKITDREQDFGSVVEENIVRFGELRPKPFLKALYQELVEFRGGKSFDDDICVICLDVD